MLFRVVIFWLVILNTTIVSSQTIKGKVIDGLTQEVLIGATIKCGEVGTTTDINGYFSLIMSVDCKLTVSYLGYTTYSWRLNKDSIIMLYPEASAIDVMVITGSKYQRRLSETTVSVDVIKPALLKSINTRSGSQILDKLPGVQIVGGQANIRGGSGFSYGAGSRVMVLIDGLPALQADSGLSNWGDIPIEAIDQIEVLKGAASSLYGSSAMNGIINFRRKTPFVGHNFEVFTSYTQYLNPSIDISKWWEGEGPRYLANIGFAQSKRIGTFDITTHGYLSNEESFREDTYTRKGRFGANVTYYLNKRLNIGFNSIVNFNKGQDYFIWDNDLRGLYKPFPGTLASGGRTRLMLDPFINYNGKKGHRHKLQMRRYYINNKNEFNRANSSANTFGEYQYQRDLEAIDLVLTTGIAASTTSTSAALFGDTSFTYNNVGIYIQGEKKIKRLSLSAGSRFEHNIQKSPTFFEGIAIPNGKSQDQAIVSRLGLSYKAADYTNLRMSWGQGYRFPTISERFIRTSFGGIEVFPNPQLTSEHGYTAEVGIKQGVKVGAINAYADFSVFTSTYYDMIEFAFLSEPLGFKPINVGDTRIYGSEISFIGNAKVDKVDLTFLTGYTYIDSKYLNFDDREEIRNNLSTDKNVLKYRSKHSTKIDIEAKWKWLNAGVSLQYYSHHVNIDKRLETLFDGVDLFKIKAFRDRNNNGYKVLNLRVGVKYKSYKCNLILGNALNTNYTVRPGLAEAPRNLTIRFDLEI